MIGNFLLVSDEDIQRVLDDPEAFDALRISAKSPSGPPHLDIDKCWEALDYLISGGRGAGLVVVSGSDLSFYAVGPRPPSDDLLHFIVAGGASIANDHGYGPPRAFWSHQVQRLAALLSDRSTEQILARFDPEAMHALYPVGVWSRLNEEHANRESLTACFEQVHRFVNDGARAELGLVVYVN
jgi:hypothetical protein